MLSPWAFAALLRIISSLSLALSSLFTLRRIVFLSTSWEAPSDPDKHSSAGKPDGAHSLRIGWDSLSANAIRQISLASQSDQTSRTFGCKLQKYLGETKLLIHAPDGAVLQVRAEGAQCTLLKFLRNT